jgi:hypothetical protein
MVVEEGGSMRLFILDQDETKVARVEQQDIKAQVRAVDASAAVPMILKPDPQEGDPAGKTSQFIGELPEGVQGKPLIVNLRLSINGEAYAPELTSAPPANVHAGMPKGVARGGGKISQAERDLYLTPGGIYSAEDIVANGNTVPSLRFKSMQWAHDDNLQAGDKVCPVTNNKADPQCSWVVNGKAYSFCCPPCLDKFVGWAKKNPEKIKEPEAYVFK